MGRGFNQSFEQNRYCYIEFGYQHAHYKTKSAENRNFEGVSPFLAGNPHVMTSRSRKYIIISSKKTPKMRRREISPHYLCKKEQPSWKNWLTSNF